MAARSSRGADRDVEGKGRDQPVHPCPRLVGGRGPLRCAVSLTNAVGRYQAERIPHTAAMIRRARRRSDTTHAVDAAATDAWYRSLEEDGSAGIIDGLAQSVELGPCR